MLRNIDDAIALVKIERECVIRADVCDRKCEKCDLLQDSTELTDMYEQIAEWLEELKVIKEMDLDIPQHFTKEQSDWIKAYCIKRNIEFYNKAIADFENLMVSALEYDWSTTKICDQIIYNNLYDKCNEIAKQLKESNLYDD